MIDARFIRRKYDGAVFLECCGHAGTAPKGEDLVCAAATMLVYTVAQAVQFLYEQGKLQRKPRIQIEDGDASICAVPKPEAAAETAMVFWVAQAGMHVLRYSYPNAIRLFPLKL